MASEDFPRKQPGSKMCFVCGLENPAGLKIHFYETEPGVVEATYTAPDHFQGYPGILHGGIVATILDETSGRALMGDPENARLMYTAKLEIKYRQNVPVGKPLKIVGKAIESRRRLARGWAGIYDESGMLLAEATALLIDLPQDALDSMDADEIGWKVYPD